MQRFVTAHSQFIANLMGNPFVYVVAIFITYIFNGIDEVLTTLFILNIVNIVFTLIDCWRKDFKRIPKSISSRVKMYVVICFGVIVDRVLGIQVDHIVSLRNYLILFYSHHEILETYNFLIKYEFYMPKSIKKYLKGGKK